MRDKRGILAGRTLIAISLLHTIVGFLLGAPFIAATARDGFINSIDGIPMRQVMFWFLFFGFVLAAWGHAITLIARNTEVPRSVGIALFAVMLGGGLLIPASGFWLAGIPAALLLAPRKTVDVVTGAPQWSVRAS